MKGKNFYLYVFMLLSTVLKAQDVTSTLLFTNDFALKQSQQKLAFGEKILFASDSVNYENSNLKNLAIICYYNTNIDTVQASITNTGWSAIVGPFPMRTNVLIKFQGEQSISKAIEKSSKDAIYHTASDIMNNFPDKSLDEEGLRMFCNSLLIKNKLPLELKTYTNEDGLNLYDGIFSLLTPIYVSMANEVYRIDSIEKRYHVSSYEELQAFQPAPDSTGENKDRYADDMVIYMKAKVAFDNDYSSIEDKFNEFASRFTYIRSIGTSVDVSGIQNYAGFDIGVIVFHHDKVALSYSFLISPYLTKTDPESDYPIFIDKKFKPSQLLHIITPTVGISIAGSADYSSIKPIYFAGGALRINRLFRVMMGTSFYFDSNQNNKMMNNLSGGLSLNINYIGDLFKMLNSATSYVPPAASLK